MSNVSAPPGTNTLDVEVTHISRHGFWLLLDERELFVAFDLFPWFRRASIEAIQDVQWPHRRHLYWPQLDVDLALESIESPERFPLVAKA